MLTLMDQNMDIPRGASATLRYVPMLPLNVRDRFRQPRNGSPAG